MPALISSFACLTLTKVRRNRNDERGLKVELLPNQRLDIGRTQYNCYYWQCRNKIHTHHYSVNFD